MKRLTQQLKNSSCRATSHIFLLALKSDKISRVNDPLCIITFEKNEDKFIDIIFYNFTGAHTLGRAGRQASGYNGPWVRGGQNDLDNRFYIDMRDRHSVQVCRLLINYVKTVEVRELSFLPLK